MPTTNMGLTLPTIGESIGSWEPKILNDLVIIDKQLGPFAGDYKVLPFDPAQGLGGGGPLLEPNGIAGEISALKFYLNRYLKVVKIAFSTSLTPDAGKFGYIGIYSIAGVRICYSKFDLSVANTIYVLATDVSVMLSPGSYYYCVGSESTIATGQTLTSFWASGLTQLISGRGTNFIAGGVMPTTLGVINPGIGGTIPSAMLLSQ